ncbi:GntR family transcriptional regulator [Pseudonocardia oroxyli]|uniref:DNA-binding transcriptional regulator, GntR family n=1 Tax=Pseudonocardia oroxyli TaxID=366584 RepID=A0A1G7VUT1_PSEOR|nr:GntR family transcriptional regulator [Pseudonocardia oroxyli]SDG63437.1 DNA-binding transcriptional regulator, GntR family [Pseudonocardia oroxyli]
MARDSESVYQQIASDIAERIENGELKDGARLPTGVELERAYKVSRQVVQNALNLLHHEGYLDSRSSRGTFVVRRPRLVLPMYAFEQEERPVDAFAAVVEEAGYRSRTEIRVEYVRSDPEVAMLLQRPSGDLVLVRRRIRYVDDVPYALSDSYFPHEMVKDSRIADPADITRGGRHVLADLGLGLASYRDSIVVRRPTRDEVRQLEIAPGCAVMAHTRVSRTSEGTPVRVLVSILPSDRWEITYEDLGGVVGPTPDSGRAPGRPPVDHGPVRGSGPLDPPSSQQ